MQNNPDGTDGTDGCTDIKILKRDGTYQDYSPEKFHKRVFEACEGLSGVSVSAIEMDAYLSISTGMKSSDIQKALIKSAENKITEEEPQYSIAACRLLNQDIRKEVYGKYEPRTLLETIDNGIKEGIYDEEYLNKYYTREELEYFQEHMDYSRDELFVYSALNVTKSKYLAKKYGKLHETPQEMFILINIFAFAKYPKELRKKWVLQGYRILSTHEASLPTPIMIQLRTRFREYISCNLIHPGDSNQSLAEASKMIMKLVAKGAGLGLAETVRGEGADIDSGRIKHTGVLPIYKAYEKLTRSFVQPSRNGSSTVYHPFFHSEIMSIMVWGNNKGTEETRIRDMDHGITFTELFFDRLKEGKDITLFYLNDVPDLSNYLSSPKEFKKRYEEYEKTVPKERTKSVSAQKICDKFLDERFLQSRLYAEFLDNVGSQGMYKVPIIMSNLCAEITQPVYPITEKSIRRNIIFSTESDKKDYFDYRRELYYYTNEKDERYQELVSKMKSKFTFMHKDINAEVQEDLDYDYFDIEGNPNLSEVGVCILGGINMGIVPDNRMPVVSEYLVRLLEELIDFMPYTEKETEKAAKMRRPLGIGFSDVFHLLAKNKLFYNTKEGRTFIAQRTELCAYYMTKTSIELAKERGACKLYEDTKYSDGLFPVDCSKETLNELVDFNSKEYEYFRNEHGIQWEELRKNLKKYGIRHSTLMANAPFGTSSVVSNSTPGIEPPRGISTMKSGVTKLVPQIKYKQYYTCTWSSDFDNVEYMKLLGVVQRVMDQSISTNEYHDLMKTQGKIPKSKLLEVFLSARYYGLKTMYYNNIRSTNQADGELEEETEIGCAGGACTV